MNSSREEARQKLHIYMSRSGLSLSEVAGRIGYSWHSLRQFSSDARYGDGDGHGTAKALLDWINNNPISAPALPGKLHQTRATKEMDAMLEHTRGGGWGIVYGPSGSQKSFLNEYRFAESAQELEPGILYIRASPSGMTPNALLRRIAAGIGAPYAQSTEGLRQSVLYTIRRRRSSLALVLDEADGLYHWIETLETLREVGDLARPRPGVAGIGILVVGNERVMQIFENRRGVYFEKWRGRIEQEELRVLGPSAEEAGRIVMAELGELKEATVQRIVEGCMVSDPVTRKGYVTAHRLFNAIRAFEAKRGGNTKGRVN
jgi:DNA transposition AAA+ family ATPase